jgi:hypothetical protein
MAFCRPCGGLKKPPVVAAVEGEVPPSVGVFENFGAVEGEASCRQCGGCGSLLRMVRWRGKPHCPWCGGGGKSLLPMVRWKAECPSDGAVEW